LTEGIRDLHARSENLLGGGTTWLRSSGPLLSWTLVGFKRWVVRDLYRSFRWNDTVCINQEDIHERASQVLLMKTIYYNAQYVLLWLGEELDGSSSALELLSQLARKGESAQFNRDNLPSMNNFEDSDICEELGIPDRYSPQWKYILKLFDRPVFRRI